MPDSGFGSSTNEKAVRFPFPRPPVMICNRPACSNRFFALEIALRDAPTFSDSLLSECVKLFGQPNRFACSTR